MCWLREELWLKRKCGIERDVVQLDLRVVFDVSQGEIAIGFTHFEGELMTSDQAIAVLWLEVQDLILPAR